MMNMSTDLELTGMELVRASQALKVQQLRAEGATLAEACEATSISMNTYRRWVTRDRVRPFVQKLTQQALIGGLMEAISAYPAAVTRLGEIATKGADRDATKATQELRAIMEKLGSPPAKPSSDGGETPAPSVGFAPKFQVKTTADGVVVKVSADPVITQRDEPPSSATGG